MEATPHDYSEAESALEKVAKSKAKMKRKKTFVQPPIFEPQDAPEPGSFPPTQPHASKLLVK